jgi:hypothetical protein
VGTDYEIIGNKADVQQVCKRAVNWVKNTLMLQKEGIANCGT